MKERLKETLVAAISEGGALMRQRVGRGMAVKFKTSWADLVTEVDGLVEERVQSLVKERFPDHGFLGEEGGGGFDQPFTWVLDPVDGTTNFAHTLPNFVCSLACYHGREALVAGIYDPSRDELFIAARGEGATLNGQLIRVDEAASLQESLICTNLMWDVREDRFQRLTQLQELGKRVRGIRSLGASALELAYVACGRVSGFTQYRLGPWDYAAGALLVTEAGGRVTRLDGGPVDVTGPSSIVASNGRIHDEMLRYLQ